MLFACILHPALTSGRKQVVLAHENNGVLETENYQNSDFDYGQERDFSEGYVYPSEFLNLVLLQ